jgi:hypothetical protein
MMIIFCYLFDISAVGKKNKIKNIYHKSICFIRFHIFFVRIKFKVKNSTNIIFKLQQRLRIQYNKQNYLSYVSTDSLHKQKMKSDFSTDHNLNKKKKK